MGGIRQSIRLRLCCGRAGLVRGPITYGQSSQSTAAFVAVLNPGFVLFYYYSLSLVVHCGTDSLRCIDTPLHIVVVTTTPCPSAPPPPKKIKETQPQLAKMGAGSGFALKLVQWFNRGIQFACCGLILALTSYFLAAMSNHAITIPTNIRAVEGISGAGVLYTGIGILLVCCLAGFAFTSFLAIVLDIAFVGAFIYVATVFKNGASSCTGDNVKTIFGSGNADARASSTKDGGVPLPTYGTACRMESAELAVAIVAM